MPSGECNGTLELDATGGPPFLGLWGDVTIGYRVAGNDDGNVDVLYVSIYENSSCWSNGRLRNAKLAIMASTGG